MIIQIDTREKSRAIEKIVSYFDANGVKHISSKLYVGDYMNLDNPKFVIDRKQSLSELCNNVNQKGKRSSDGTYRSEWGRFNAELQRAVDAGIKMIILCEHGAGIHDLTDVAKWENPRKKESAYAIDGKELQKRLYMLQAKYGVKFLFCTKAQTGKRIVELLEVKDGTSE